MSKVAELRESIKKATADIRSAADGYNERRKAGKSGAELWPDETKKSYDEANTRYDSLTKELQSEEEAASVEARMNKINEDEKQSTRNGKQMPGLDDVLPGEERTYGDAGFDKDGAKAHAQGQVDRRQALRAWLIRSTAPHLITADMRDACQRLNFYPDVEQYRLNLADTESYAALQERAAQCHPTMRAKALREASQEIRAMAKGTSGAGAELVPTTFIGSMELAMLAYGPFLAYVDTITTETGEPMQWPVGDDTGNEGTTVAENADTTAGGTPDATLTSFSVTSYEYISKFIMVSMALNRDSIVNLDLILARMLGERFGRIFTRHGTVGDGTGKMKGVTLDAAAGKTTASATAITSDEIIDLQQSLDPAYRSGAAFMAHDNIIGAIRKLKDSQGRYLWESNIAIGRPDTIYGQPAITNQYMASTIATTNITMLYGDFSFYKFRRVGSSAYMIRATERFIEKLQTGYLGWISADGKLLKPNATTSNPVKKLTQA